MNTARKVSPFPVASKKRTSPVDVSMLKIEHNTPIPSTRYVSGKYESTFEKLKPGSCVVCEYEERETLRHALIKWLVRKGKADQFTVTSVSKCEDKRARVWLVKK